MFKSFICMARYTLFSHHKALKKTLIVGAALFMGWSSWADINCHTKYPIVLSHGLFGYAGSIGFYSYWSDIPEVLKDCGATVYIAHVSQAHQTAERGKQLRDQLVRWGHKKYNLVGHSHGGLDARYVLENYPDLVASVTTIGTPHRGSKVADRLISRLSVHSAAETITAWLGNILGYSIGFLSGHINWQNARLALLSLTTPALEQFNQTYSIGVSPTECGEGEPDYQGKKLYSWGSNGHSATAFYDWFGHLMERASQIFAPGEENDGLVAVCSMKFGHWLGTLPNAHHLIPVGGVVSPIPWELHGVPEAIFVEHAQRLQSEGL